MSEPTREHQHRNELERSRTEPRRRSGGSGLVFGLILLSAGVIFLLDNLGIVDSDPFLQWWPLALIAIGISELIGGSRAGGAIWIAFGGWFLLYNFDLLHANPFELFWPTLLTVVGSLLVWQTLGSRPAKAGASRMSAFAFMAGNVQRGSAEAIDRVQAAAVMGGCEIDLRSMKRGDAPPVIDVFALWGGIEITIPEGWGLDNRVTPLLAGVEDKTAPPAPDAPRVVLSGTLVMGGVEVRN